MKKQTELLAPAGDFEALVTAVKAGADAIYFGIKDFNMRARAKNFTIKDLPKIAKLCKLKNKTIKKYLTLNTIMYDSELKKAEKIIKKAKPYINAIICSDISIMMLCRKHQIPFHVSTQCSVSNSKTAEFYERLGAERIVLARELNLSQIKKISKIIPVECFIHGAMCVSISGRCFLSQHLCNQSANKGKCIQPCRRPYTIKDNQGKELRITNHHIFSAKDLCTLPFIDKLKKAGITSFKIEGRSREPEYVDTVVKVYKHALNKKSKLTPLEIKQAIEELNKVYTKGFSSGFYIKSPTSNDFSDVEHSKATQKKMFIGKINHYYKKLGVAKLKLNNGPLRLGDNVLIMGNTTPLIRHKITSMQIKNKDIKIAKKTQEVAIKVPLCRKNDELYLIIKK